MNKYRENAGSVAPGGKKRAASSSSFEVMKIV
jgi:hypothetical protein